MISVYKESLLYSEHYLCISQKPVNYREQYKNCYPQIFFNDIGLGHLPDFLPFQWNNMKCMGIVDQEQTKTKTACIHVFHGM